MLPETLRGHRRQQSHENGRQVGRTGALGLLGASAAKLSLALPPARRRLIWQFLEVNA